MTCSLLQSFLGWCGVLNYFLLVIWFLLFLFAHEFLYKIHSRWFQLSVESFDKIHYQGMAYYKILILFFNIIPFFALILIGGK